MALQFAFAIFILKTPIGLRLFQGAQVVVDQLNVYANEGAKMVFGPLGDGEALRKAFGPGARLRLCRLGRRHHHPHLRSFFALLSLGRSAKSRRRNGVGHDENNAHEWQRKPGRRCQHFPRPKRSGARHQTLSAEDDAERNRRRLMTTGFSTIATGVMAVYAGMEGISAGHILTASVLGAPGGFADVENHVSGDRSERDGRRVVISRSNAQHSIVSMRFVRARARE